MSAERDEILEMVALAVEEPSLMDIRGILSKRKRSREDADLRRKTREEQRAELAQLIRAMKTSPRYDPVKLLAEIADMPERQHNMWLIDAWPLSWKGWIDIYCTMKCTGNSHPPETDFRIEITKAGREVLAAITPALAADTSALRENAK